MKSALLIILQLAASGSDAYFTHRNLQKPTYRERDPLARPFVHSTVGTVAFFGAGAGVQIYIPHVLRKHGHNRLADAMALAGIADNSEGAIYSATH